MRNALVPPGAVGAPAALPAVLSLRGRRGVAVAGGRCEKPAPRLRQGFDAPGQHPARQRAVSERAVLAVPNRKDRAGIGHREGEAVAERDARHAIQRSQLRLFAWPRSDGIVASSRPPREESGSNRSPRSSRWAQPRCSQCSSATRCGAARRIPRRGARPRGSSLTGRATLTMLSSIDKHRSSYQDPSRAPGRSWPPVAQCRKCAQAATRVHEATPSCVLRRAFYYGLSGAQSFARGVKKTCV